MLYHTIGHCLHINQSLRCHTSKYESLSVKTNLAVHVVLSENSPGMNSDSRPV